MTSVFAFWDGIEFEACENLGRLVAACPTVRRIAIVQPATKYPEELMVHSYEFPPLRLVDSNRVTMVGGAQHTAYVFEVLDSKQIDMNQDKAKYRVRRQ